MFTTIGLIAKQNDFTSEQSISQLSLWLKENGLNVVLTDAEIRKSADLIIVAGGDGTLLAMARKFVDDNIPILGVNMGRLGFLADVYPDKMISSIEQVISGKFISESRALLVGELEKNGQILSKHLAFNDVVVHRHQSSKVIKFEIYVNDKFTHSQRADGLIISTPTGSTAYALSSGGPIIHPNIPAISLVPICPHTLSNRPFLVPENSQIRIQLSEHKQTAMVSFDAQVNIELMVSESLLITQYSNRISLIHPKDYDFFNIVRSKLQWGEKL